MRSSSISCFLFLSYLLLLVLALALAACFFWLASYSFFLSFLALSCTLPSYRVCLLLPSVSPIAACNVFCDDAPPCCRHGVGGYALYTHITVCITQPLVFLSILVDSSGAEGCGLFRRCIATCWSGIARALEVGLYALWAQKSRLWCQESWEVRTHPGRLPKCWLHGQGLCLLSLAFFLSCSPDSAMSECLQK